MIGLGSFLFGLPKLNHPKLKRTYERKCLTIFWTKLPTLTFNFSYTFSVILFSASFVFLLIGFFCCSYCSFKFFFFFYHLFWTTDAWSFLQFLFLLSCLSSFFLFIMCLSFLFSNSCFFFGFLNLFF